MLLFNIGEAPKIISAIFGPFLTIFTLFHLQFLLQSKNLPQIISGTPQFLIGLVNNARNQCQKLCKIFWLLNFLQRRCVRLLFRFKHSSWAINDEILLMGGRRSSGSLQHQITEVLKKNGDSYTFAWRTEGWVPFTVYVKNRNLF